MTLAHQASTQYAAGVPRRIAFSTQIRRAVERAALTRYRIAQETGIPESSLSRFVAGGQGLSMDNLDKLADLLDLRVVEGERAKKG